MIPRHQTVLFFILLAASIAMGAVLWQLREHAHQRLLESEVSTPTHAPEVAPEVQATLLVANDADDSLLTQELSLPLPPSANERARAILGKLLDLYAAPNATHPVPGGASSIVRVFLMPAPEGARALAGLSAAGASPAGSNAPGSATLEGTENNTQNGPELAVVDLTSAFANSHPSGIETESLTVLSICGTLRANLPRVTEVHFLVDGQPRATLAGHADLTRTYLTTEAEPAAAAQP